MFSIEKKLCLIFFSGQESRNFFSGQTLLALPQHRADRATRLRLWAGATRKGVPIFLRPASPTAVQVSFTFFFQFSPDNTCQSSSLLLVTVVPLFSVGTLLLFTAMGSFRVLWESELAGIFIECMVLDFLRPLPQPSARCRGYTRVRLQCSVGNCVLTGYSPVAGEC